MKSNEIHARKCLKALVEHIKEGIPKGYLYGLTYQKLAEEIGLRNKHGASHARGMGRILGCMGHLLEKLEEDWGEKIPLIQCLVLKKGTSLPGDGIKEFWPDYPGLSDCEKMAKVELEHQRILNYGSRWDDVLAAVSLEETVNPSLSKEDSERE